MSQSKQATIAKQPNKVEAKRPAQFPKTPELLAVWGQPPTVMRRLLADSRSLNAAKIAYLQRTIGNQALGQLKINSHPLPVHKNVEDESLYLTHGLAVPPTTLRPAKQQEIEPKDRNATGLQDRSQGELHFPLSGQIQRDDQPWYEEAGEWALGAVGGEFIDEQSFSQIGVDFVLSVIPYVDQAADARDLTAHIYRLGFKGEYNKWLRWVALVFTLIGLVPEIGSVIKSLSKAAIRGLLEHITDILRAASRILPGDITDIGKLQKFIRENWSRFVNFGLGAWNTLLSRGHELLQRIPHIISSARNWFITKIKNLQYLSPGWLSRAYEHVKTLIDDALEKIHQRLQKRILDALEAKAERLIHISLHDPKARELIDELAQASVNNRFVKGGHTVLGSFPEYVEHAQSGSLSYFNMPTAVWKVLEKAGVEYVWAVNKRFLDLAVAAEQKFVYQVGKGKVPGQYLQKEIRYLVNELGYVARKEDSMIILVKGR